MWPGRVAGRWLPARRIRAARKQWPSPSLNTCNASATNQPTYLPLVTKSTVQPRNPVSPGNRAWFLECSQQKRFLPNKATSLCCHLKSPGERLTDTGRSPAETTGAGRGGGPHLLRWCYALLLIKFRCLLRLNLQAQTFLKSLVLKH